MEAYKDIKGTYLHVQCDCGRAVSVHKPECPNCLADIPKGIEAFEERQKQKLLLQQIMAADEQDGLYENTADYENPPI